MISYYILKLGPVEEHVNYQHFRPLEFMIKRNYHEHDEVSLELGMYSILPVPSLLEEFAMTGFHIITISHV